MIATAPAGNPPSVISPEDWPERAEGRVNELTRDRHGHVALTWTVRNDDDRPLNVWTSSHDHSGLYEPSGTSAAALVAGERRYRVLRDGTARLALGPNLQSTDLDDYMVEKGEQYTLWAMFKLPPELTSVTVQIPGFEPVPDVPIS